MKDRAIAQTPRRQLQELRTPIGIGRTADVFAWGDKQVLKLDHADLAPEAIERERMVAEALGALPVAAPRHLGRVQLEDRAGLVFERINGPSMLAVLGRQPWRVVALGLLFETGGRIFEVTGLTLGDWANRGLTREATAASKASHGRRVKFFRFSSETATLLRRYFDSNRRAHDRMNWRLADFTSFTKSCT